MRNVVLCLGLFFLIFPCFSQQQESEGRPVNLVYQSTTLGIGGISVYDSYLSPLKYKGSAYDLFHEQIKMTGMMNGHIAAQHQFNLDFGYSMNEPETASDYSGFIEYAYGLHYRFNPVVPKLQLFAGMQAAGLLGFIYNSRNGNNPATGKAHLNLNLSGIAAYQFEIKSQPVRLRYQLNVPFAGMMFSPHYGQSYYEISLGDDDDLVHLASFHNQTSMRNILSVEFPFSSVMLRLTYMNTIYETNINDLQTRVHTNVFCIGFSKDFFSVGGKKRPKNKYNGVFD
ncbi:hypothetical protein FACS1894155_01420 [Bacteroidia bacterium]|nr:hypothetical protein FACS1894155_01420 [Bacteroidia bacterium]